MATRPRKPTPKWDALGCGGMTGEGGGHPKNLSPQRTRRPQSRNGEIGKPGKLTAKATRSTPLSQAQGRSGQAAERKGNSGKTSPLINADDTDQELGRKGRTLPLINTDDTDRRCAGERRLMRKLYFLLDSDGLDLVERNEIRGVNAGIAGGAIGRLLTFSTGLAQPFKRKIRQRVGANIVADFFQRFVGSDELAFGRRVHAVKARRNSWRTGDANVNFSCAGVAHHTDDLAAGCAANNGIVDQDYALAGEQTANGIQLELDAEVAHTLLRFDERASDVMVADQPKAKRQQRFRRISQSRSHTGVRHGNDKIGFNGRFLGKLPAHGFTAGLHGPTEDDAIWTREIYVLKDASGLLHLRSEVARESAFRTDDDHLSGLDVTLIDGADEIERAGFRGEDNCVAGGTAVGNASHGKRTKAARIANGKDAVARHHDERKRAFDPAKSVANGFRQRVFLGLRDQMHDHFSIAGGLEDGTLRFKPCADFIRVHQVAVVRDSNHALVAVHHDGLRVEHGGITGSGVTRMSDSKIAQIGR